MSVNKEIKQTVKQYTRKTSSFREGDKEIVVEEYKETIGESEISDDSDKRTNV